MGLPLGSGPFRQGGVPAPDKILAKWNPLQDSLGVALQVGRAEWAATMSLMMSLQEELDWRVYSSYKLLPGSGPHAQRIHLRSIWASGRSEISLARRMADRSRNNVVCATQVHSDY